MSGDWWANQVGTASAATTPNGSVPQYSLAADVGTAVWPDQYTFNTWAEDTVRRTRKPDIERIQATKDQSEAGWFQKGLAGLGSAVTISVGAIADTLSGDLPEFGFGAYQNTDGYREQAERGSEVFGAIGALPGMSQVGAAYHKFYQGLATPFVASTEGYRSGDGWWFLKGDNWSEAWQLAEERSPGQAAVDWVLTGQDPQRAQKDLDRLKRTNSLYGLTSFAADLAISWKIDPAVVGAKGISELNRTRAGQLPHMSTRPAGLLGLRTEAGTVHTQALRAARGDAPNRRGPAAMYGQWRGDRIARNFDELRDAATSMPFADFANMPMFRRRNATNGAAAAELFRIAAKDDNLWDLTKRAVLADPKAWAEIKAMQTNPEMLSKYVGSEGRTYLDALDATKGKFSRLDQEVKDLERLIATRQVTGPGKNAGFFEYYNKELHATYEQKVADLDELEKHLTQYSQYKTWLDGIPTFNNPATSIEAVKVKPGKLDYLSQRTYQEGIYGKVHQVHEISKGGWLREANPIDLHRVDTGVQSLRRQFEQFDHLFGYRNPAALQETLESFTVASMAGDAGRAARIARRVEQVHLTEAISQKFGLQKETVLAFLNQTRFRMNEMTNALLSGDGAVYTTVPGQETKLLRRNNGMAEIEVTEGGKRTTIKVPEEALEGMKDTSVLAQDITQTPNWYTPLNTRQLFYAIKHDAELFTELDTAMQLRGRTAAGATMELVDKWGTAWNKFWKPLQLFRLAWPQRVLMDEGLRGMAILGTSAWARSYGDAFLKASLNAVNPLEHGPIAAFRRRKTLKIGPGPLADQVTGRSYDTAIHDALASDAPFVPSYFAPKRSAKRAEALGQMAPRINYIRTQNIKRAALARLDAERTNAVMSRLRDGGKVDRNTLPHIPEVPKHVSIDLHDADEVYDLPIHRTLRAFGLGSSVRAVVDPITGKKVTGGFAVPVASKELRRNPGELRASGEKGGEFYGHEEHDLGYFLADNQDLLGSQGYRIMFEQTNDLSISAHVVRIFRTSERDKAVNFAQHVDADRFINMEKDYPEFIRDWNDKSPIMEALDRRFVNSNEPELVPGSMPTNEGDVSVFHGATSPLPVDDQGFAALKAKDDPSIPVANGRMIGDGFYTSTSLEEVRAAYAGNGYSWNGGELYTIRGARSGQPHTVFDLDKPITKRDRKKLLDAAEVWANEQRAMIRGKLGVFDQHGIWEQSDVDWWLDRFEGDYNSFRARIELGRSGSGGSSTWVELMAGSSEWYHVAGSIYPRRFITKFLEDNYNAKALAHTGGTRGSLTGATHRVYVWLDPEDLQVRPAYEQNDRWYNLEEWFDNPASLDNMVGMDPQYFPQHGQLKNQVPESRINRTGAKPQARARMASGELRAQERAVEDGDMFDGLDFDIHIDSVHERFIRRLMKRREFGRGYMTYRDANGKKIRVPKSLEGPGEIYVPLMSGAPAYARLTDSYKRTLSMGQSRAIGYKRILPPDVSTTALTSATGRKAAAEYYTSWADLVNDQIRNSPIWSKMLKGESDEQIINWLDNTAEGARLRKTLPHKGYDPLRWVEEHRQALDFYVPRRDLQALLQERRINPSDLRRVDRDSMPEIYGPDLEMIEGSTALGRTWGKFVERTYTALGTTPTDLLSRQPFFDGMYRLKMKNLIAATDPEDLTDELMQAYAKQAREFALRQVKRTMYDLGDDSNFTQAIRFLAPFWGAQEEAVRKWMSIAIERPETVSRFYLGMDQAYDRLTVVDEDGKPTKDPHTLFGYNPNDRVVLQIPKQLRKIAPFDKMLGQFGSIGVAFGSANTALQGDQPLLPSLGPLVTMPADKLINMLWEDHGTEFDDNFFYRWLFPVGRPAGGVEGYLDYILPGWGRRMSQLRQGQDNRTYANTYFTVLRELERDHRKRGLPPPTPEEISSATKWHFALRVVAGFAAPVAMEFRPKHQFYLDQYHAMQQKFGPARAFEKFVEKFGADAARYAASSSESVAGVPPTSVGMGEWKASQKLIAKYKDWGSAIISPDAWADDFSSDAYGAQFGIKLGPGSSETLRNLRDPEERIADTDTRLGWLDYRQFSSALNAELYARGLSSIQQVGAEDLQVLKQQFLTELAAKYPAWNEDYRTFSDTIYQRVADLAEFAGDKRFDNRPDFQGVRQYLMIREQVAQSLDQYYLQTGGSRSLQAEENTELRNWFYTQVGQLIQDNPMFGEFYTRYLDTDRLERGSGP